jgi:hypothetical protein
MTSLIWVVVGPTLVDRIGPSLTLPSLGMKCQVTELTQKKISRLP